MSEPTKLHKGRYATCIACTHFFCSTSGGCETCGDETTAGCSKDYWVVGPTYQEAKFSVEIHRAQTCVDFKGRE